MEVTSLEGREVTKGYDKYLSREFEVCLERHGKLFSSGE